MAEITNRIVAFMREHYGRGPIKAKTYVLDNLIVCVLTDGFIAIERTMMEGGQPERVLEMRRDFQALMKARYSEMIQELTGRKVLAFLSQAHVEPDLTIEMFLMDGPVPGFGALELVEPGVPDTGDSAPPERHPPAGRRSPLVGAIRVRARRLAGSTPPRGRIRSRQRIGQSGGAATEMQPTDAQLEQDAAATAARPSLVDGAETALRNWLAPGRYRQGDRLPPEHEVAAMLGVSRGTLRSALQRLERSGEIVRRQGSGTFVGRMGFPTAFGERLERLEPYSSVAERRGLSLAAIDVEIELRAVEQEASEALELPDGTQTTTISRTLVAGGAPVAVMYDVIHPEIALPSLDRLRAALTDGRMVLDVLIEAGVPITFARTRVIPALVSGPRALGKAARHQRHDRVPGAGGADLRQPGRARGLLAGPVRSRRHRRDGHALA